MGHISTDPNLRPLDPLLNLGQELIDQLRPRHGPTRQGAVLPGGDIPGDGVVRDPGELAGIP